MRGAAKTGWATDKEIRVAEFTNSFYLGGTEGQVVELLRSLPKHYRLSVAVLNEAGPLLEIVHQLGHVPTAFPLRGSVGRPHTAVQIARLARWLLREKVELVHAHDFFSTLLAVPAARLARCKVLVGRLDLAHWQSRVQRIALALMTRMADHVIANAQAIRQMLIDDEKIEPNRISIIHNGIDLARFDERVKSGLAAPLPHTGGDAIALLVANMNHPVKRQEDFLVALAHARAQGQRVQGFLVGDGPRRSQLEQLVGELGLEGAAHFLGHRSDVPALYASATVGILCSNAEGLSNAIIEGMAAGLPMVVTKVGGNPELITHRERGLLVPPEQPFDLSSALSWILTNRSAAREMGATARRYVEEELSVARLAQEHDRLYQRVARGSPNGLDARREQLDPSEPQPRMSAVRSLRPSHPFHPLWTYPSPGAVRTN